MIYLTEQVKKDPKRQPQKRRRFNSSLETESKIKSKENKSISQSKMKTPMILQNTDQKTKIVAQKLPVQTPSNNKSFSSFISTNLLAYGEQLKSCQKCTVVIFAHPRPIDSWT